MQDLNFQRGKVLVPDRHGASSWKRWIFCPTDHLDFENLENRRRYHNPGKPRTAGLCGREVVASDHLPLSSTFFGRPKPPDLPPKNRRFGTTSQAVFSLEIRLRNVLVNFRPHRPHMACSLRGVPQCYPLRQSPTQPLTGGNEWRICPGPRFLPKRPASFPAHRRFASLFTAAQILMWEDTPWQSL